MKERVVYKISCYQEKDGFPMENQTIRARDFGPELAAKVATHQAKEYAKEYPIVRVWAVLAFESIDDISSFAYQMELEG